MTVFCKGIECCPIFPDHRIPTAHIVIPTIRDCLGRFIFHSDILKEKCVREQIRIEHQVCGHRRASAFCCISASTCASAADGCAGHRINSIDIFCNYTVLRSCTCAHGKCVAHILKSGRMYSDRIFSCFRNIVASVFCILIIVKDKRVSDQIPVTDLLQFGRISMRICKFHLADRNLDSISHVLHFKVNILSACNRSSLF